MSLVQEIGIVDESVVLEDLTRLEAWYKLLKKRDIENVKSFLKSAYAWARITVSAYCQSNHHVLSAVGSTINGKPDYRDIDFLLVTDLLMRDLSLYVGLEKVLKEKFHMSVNPNIDETYKCRHSRTMATLRPRSKGTPVHLILQPDHSEEDWDREDLYDKVKIFRTSVINDNPKEEDFF